MWIYLIVVVVAVVMVMWMVMAMVMAWGGTTVGGRTADGGGLNKGFDEGSHSHIAAGGGGDSKD